MNIERIHDLPYDWKSSLWNCTNFTQWFVFADWLEEQGSRLKKGIRWLATNKKLPIYAGAEETRDHIYLQQLYFIETNPKMYLRWWYGVTNSPTNILYHAILPLTIYNKLPHRRIMRHVTPEHNEPVNVIKWYPCILKAYICAAKAIDIVYTHHKNNPKGSGAFPNWMVGLENY